MEYPPPPTENSTLKIHTKRDNQPFAALCVYHILDAYYANDEDDYIIKVDIAFSEKCIKTFVVDTLLPTDKMEEEIEEIVETTKSLNSIKFKPFFIRLGKISVFYEYGEILRFRKLNDECFNYLMEIVSNILEYYID